MASTDLGTLMVWEASNSPGEPVCVSNNSDGGFSLNLYLDEVGDIVGVTVHEQDAFVMAVGMVPAEVLVEELKYAKN